MRNTATIVVGALLAGPVSAGERDWHVDVGVGTDLPISLGVYGKVELPYRIRGRVGLGWMPGPYLDMVNAISVGAGWYDQTVGDLIDLALRDSLVVHTSVGWRPLPKAGFHFDFGYEAAVLGGSLTGAETVETLSGEELPREVEEAMVDVKAASTAHLLSVNVGWEFVVKERLVFDVGLGGAFTVGAQSRLSADLTTDRPVIVDAVDRALREGEAYLDDLLVRYVHTPTIRVGVAYRF